MDDIDAIIDRLHAEGATDDEITEILREKSGTHAMGPVNQSEPDTTPSQVQHGPQPGTNSALSLAAGSQGVHAASNIALRVATNPNMAKTGRTIGGATGGILGMIKAGPVGAASGMYAGEKIGEPVASAVQKAASPAARIMGRLAPYAQTLSTLSGAAGVGDLAQMAEPDRRDIGFMGIGGSVDVPGAEPPVLNAAYDKAKAMMQRLYGRMAR